MAHNLEDHIQEQEGSDSIVSHDGLTFIRGENGLFYMADSFRERNGLLLPAHMASEKSWKRMIAAGAYALSLAAGALIPATEAYASARVVSPPKKSAVECYVYAVKKGDSLSKVMSTLGIKGISAKEFAEGNDLNPKNPLIYTDDTFTYCSDGTIKYVSEKNNSSLSILKKSKHKESDDASSIYAIREATREDKDLALKYEADASLYEQAGRTKKAMKAMRKAMGTMPDAWKPEYPDFGKDKLGSLENALKTKKEDSKKSYGTRGSPATVGAQMYALSADGNSPMSINGQKYFVDAAFGQVVGNPDKFQPLIKVIGSYEKGSGDMGIGKVVRVDELSNKDLASYLGIVVPSTDGKMSLDFAAVWNQRQRMDRRHFNDFNIDAKIDTTFSGPGAYFAVMSPNFTGELGVNYLKTKQKMALNGGPLNLHQETSKAYNMAEVNVGVEGYVLPSKFGRHLLVRLDGFHQDYHENQKMTVWGLGGKLDFGWDHLRLLYVPKVTSINSASTEVRHGFGASVKW